jgi:hypothetical protein
MKNNRVRTAILIKENHTPPKAGWATCRASGLDPPPTLAAIGWMVPSGQEGNTLEHQLAKWAIEQHIVEQVLGDTTSHREVVARSTALIKFLAQMCSREDGILPKVPEHVARQQLPPTPPEAATMVATAGAAIAKDFCNFFFCKL